VNFIVRESEVIERKKPTQIIDDLFRKTVATPSIYWLPLTAEQVSYMKNDLKT
jgi:apoptotic chromatin condensation inducer in the nucleus